MARYDAEKFEKRDDGTEQKVYWRKDKHHHNAALITVIEVWLGEVLGGVGMLGTAVTNLGCRLRRKVPLNSMVVEARH